MKNLRRLSLILTVLIASAVVPAAASAQWWTTTPRTVHNFCFLNRGLGPYVTGQFDGISYAAFDTSHDGVADAWVFDLDRNGYYDTVVIDNNERGRIDVLGICAAPRHWYTPAAIRAAVQRTRRAASAQREPVSTCAETPGCESFLNQQLFDASSGLGSADGIYTNPETGNPDGM
jgi:hypothetical protein